MRSTAQAILVTVILFAGIAERSIAQQYKREFVLQANAGFSLVGSVMHAAFRVSDYNIVGLETRSLPGLSTSLDFGLNQRISVGACFYVQTASAQWTSYRDTILDSIYVGTFDFNLKRSNYSMRMLCHFGNKDRIDPYLGIRVGFTQWSLRSSVVNYEDLLNVKFARNFPSFQFLFGFRYYVLTFLAVNAEVAFGPPYFLSAGISCRFGGQK